jgi:hypothetical protein
MGARRTRPLRVEYKQVGGRLVGANRIPGRAWLDGYAQPWELLGARRQVSELTRLADQAKAECPRVLSWVERNPVRALQLTADWDRLLATVALFGDGYAVNILAKLSWLAAST